MTYYTVRFENMDFTPSNSFETLEDAVKKAEGWGWSAVILKGDTETAKAPEVVASWSALGGLKLRKA